MVQKQFALDGAKDGARWGALGGSVATFVYVLIVVIVPRDETFFRMNPTGYYEAKCVLVVLFLIFGGIVGAVFGGIGGLVDGGIAEMFFERGIDPKYVKWFIGVFAGLYGIGVWPALIIWTGVLEPCFFGSESFCDPSVPIEFSVYMSHVFFAWTGGSAMVSSMESEIDSQV